MSIIFYIVTFILVILALIVACWLWAKISVATNPNPSRSNYTKRILNDDSSSSAITVMSLGSRGDLGNQMFEIATAWAAAKHNQCSIVLPTKTKSLSICSIFDLDQSSSTPTKPINQIIKYNDLFTSQRIREYYNYEEIFIPLNSGIWDIRGYRQCYRYFDDYRNEIKQLFTPKVEYLEAVRKLLPPVYIAIHIRLGDTYKLYHELSCLCREGSRCSTNYYRSAIVHLRRMLNNNTCPVFICTNLPKLIDKELLSIDHNIKLAPLASNIPPVFSDFCVLYAASGMAMAMSTFSWWAAYVGTASNVNNVNDVNVMPDDSKSMDVSQKHPQAIIAPSPWWYSGSFIATATNIDGPYLHYPAWLLLDPITGEVKREPFSLKGELPDNDKETADIVKYVRGFL